MGFPWWDIDVAIRMDFATRMYEQAATSSGGWSVGDTCEAIWASDGGYYKAVIESVTDEKCPCWAPWPLIFQTAIWKRLCLSRAKYPPHHALRFVAVCAESLWWGYP